MKRMNFLPMGAAALLLAFVACTDEVAELPVGELKQIVMTASDFETENGSRTNFQITSSGAEFSWAANDTVGIFPNEGAQAYFPMTSGAGTKSANFTGGGWALKDASTYAAYYPFIGNFYLDKNAIPVDYTGQVQTGDASTAHLGAYDYMAAAPSTPKNGNVVFAFKHLGALVQLKVIMPEPTTIHSVSFVAEREAFAAEGKVDIMSSNPCIVSTITSKKLSLQVKDVITTEADQVVTLYLMLPPTDLSSQKLKAVVSTSEGSKEVTLESKNFLAGKAYALTGKFEGEFVAETDYVDLKFDTPNVTTNYNENNGSLTMTYPSGNVPSVKVGNSIVLPAEYGFDIRVIESVDNSGNKLIMKTSQGNMANLFRNTSFTLTTDPEVASRSMNSNVYTPSAYGYIDENGRYHEIYNKSRAVYPIENIKWETKIDFNDKKIYEGKAGTLSWDKCEFSAGLKETFTFDFGSKTIDEVREVGDLKRIDYKLTGSVNMDMLLHYNYKYEYKESGDTIIKYNAIPTVCKTFNVPVGGIFVPVTIQIYTHLGQMYACQIKGKLDATAGVKMGNEVSVGLEWTPEGGTKPIREVRPTFEFYPLTVKAEASAEAKVSYYPQWEIGIYNFKAIWLEPRPYLKEEVEAGFRFSTAGENYIGWKSKTYNGMDIRMGLETEFGFWRKDIWVSDIYNCVKDRLLFEAPSRVRTLSPENNIKVEKGESVTAEFITESFSPITNKYYPCPWALVNFEPECGKLDKEVAIADLNGKVSVDWTPTSGKNTSTETRATETVKKSLVAKVVDKNGESISETSLIVKTDTIPIYHIDFNIEYPKYYYSHKDTVECAVALSPIYTDKELQKRIVETCAILYKNGKEVLRKAYTYKGRNILRKKFDRKELTIDNTNYIATPKDNNWQVSMLFKELDKDGDTIVHFTDVMKDAKLRYDTKPTLIIYYSKIEKSDCNFYNIKDYDHSEHSFMHTQKHFIKGRFWLKEIYDSGSGIHGGIGVKNGNISEYIDDYFLGSSGGGWYTNKDKPQRIVLRGRDYIGRLVESNIIPVKTDSEGCIIYGSYDNTSAIASQYANEWNF